MAEVDQVTDWLSSQTQAVDELRLMFRGKPGNGLEFDDQAVEDKEVGNVAFLERAALVMTQELLLDSGVLEVRRGRR